MLRARLRLTPASPPPRPGSREIFYSENIFMTVDLTIDAESVLHAWSAPLALDAALLLAVLVYARGWFHLRRVFPDIFSPWRPAAFVAGIVSIWIAIGSPLNAFDELSLTVHMIQHLLLMAIAPPLILLSAPALPLLHGLPQWLSRNVVGPFLRWSPAKWLGRAITNPAVAWLSAALTLLIWHVPAIFDLALRSDALHKFEHATFFTAGLIFWWPVVQPWPSIARSPRWSIPLYLFAATLPCDALSGFLVFCDRVVYSSYLSAPRVFQLSPLQDQECAAALMWVCVTIIFLVPAVIVTLQLLSPPKNRSRAETSAPSPGIAAPPLNSRKLEVI
jgi:putative membrane protein